MDFTQMSDNERVKWFRKTIQMSQATFSEKLGMKQPNYSAVERGKRSVSYQLLINLSDKFDINSRWITEGKGLIISNSNSNYVYLNEQFRTIIEEKEDEQSYLTNSIKDLARLAEENDKVRTQLTEIPSTYHNLLADEDYQKMTLEEKNTILENEVKNLYQILHAKDHSIATLEQQLKIFERVVLKYVEMQK